MAGATAAGEPCDKKERAMVCEEVCWVGCRDMLTTTDHACTWPEQASPTTTVGL
eukprot:m.480140 g.480140  ORF g.480140 m.480140 type:complete len:54 (+) comp21709_c0_seq1:1881-2042(+)